MQSAESIRDQAFSILESDLLDAEDTAFMCYDLDVLTKKMKAVQKAFPDFKHCVAVKANPLQRVLQHIPKFGFGLEGASFEEVLLSSEAGAFFIAWDSPVKTDVELERARTIDGLIVNANGISDLKRIVDAKLNARLSLRINPQRPTSSHASMTVSGAYSKFGEPISNRADIVDTIVQMAPSVRGLHVHSSSQTKDLSGLVHGIRQVLDLALEINLKSPGLIDFIDIGGGFPAPYAEGEVYHMQDYADALRRDCPELFDDAFDVYTEFGRYYHANSGWTASRVHEVKRFDDRQVAILHVGADMFLREAYHPEVWSHEYFVLGKASANEVFQTDLAGPLCFGGDFIARGVELPKLEEGDWLIIRDTGANSIALWSRHCSRPMPKIIGFETNPFLMKGRERFGAIVATWR